MAIDSSTGGEGLCPSSITSSCSSDRDADIVFVEGVGVYIASGTFIPSVVVETALFG
jgi:hypothetical protein